MRNLLIALLLLIAVVLIYDATFGGEDGAASAIRDRGKRVHLEVGGIDL